MSFPRLFLAALAFSLVVAVANDLPARKPGVWELTRSPPDPRFPPQVQEVCLDAATDAMLYRFGVAAGRQMCSKVDIHNAGGKVVVDAVCTIGGSQATSHSVTTFIGDAAYHDDIAVRFDPPLGKKSETQSTQDAKWMGPCPPDMKPGDIVTKPSPMMPTTLRMNIRDMLNDSK